MKAAIKVPTEAPTVTTIAFFAPVTDVSVHMHATVVAEDQEVVSHSPPPILTVAVALLAPKFSPEIVTEMPVLV